MRQGKSRLERYAQRLTADKHTHDSKNEFSDNHEQRQDYDWHPEFAEHVRVYHHSDRDEEDGAEEVFYRGCQFLNSFSLAGSGKDGAHEECSERGGEAGIGGGDYHQEAQPDAKHQHKLVGKKPALARQERRYGIDADHIP